MMSDVSLSDKDFYQYKELLYSIAGIDLSISKKSLVSGRLTKRLKATGLTSYGEYFQLLVGGKQPDEMQTAIDLLTTNETYFFREPKHFNFLRDTVLPNHPIRSQFRVWSAASSSGQETYSIAMMLAEYMGGQLWEVVGSDISMRVLDKARNGNYPIAQAKHIQSEWLAKYCLKGVGSEEGNFLIDPKIRSRIVFKQVNLNLVLPDLGQFDLVFLRNIMIYFDNETKQQVMSRIVGKMKSGAYLMIGHSETLNGITDSLDAVVPSIYRKP
jgi:chemotaxis protein methyltransferase CheR